MYSQSLVKIMMMTKQGNLNVTHKAGKRQKEANLEECKLLDLKQLPY